MEQPKKTGKPAERPERAPAGTGRAGRGRPASGSKTSGAVNTFSYILMILGVSLIISAFAIVIGNDVFALVKTEKAITLTLSQETKVSEIASLLKDDGIIKYPWAFQLFAGLKKTDAFSPGDYTLDSDMDYGQIISELTSAKSYQDTVTLTFPEGYTMQQIAEELEKNRVCTQDDFFDVANNYAFAHFMLKDVPMAENRLEGYLFPDTYEFYQVSEKAMTEKDTHNSAVNAINKMLNNFVKKYTKSMRTLTEEQGLTIAQVINVASLVEKEAKLADERTMIAGVIYNRLNHSDKYPFLNIDATLLYVLGHKDKLTDADLQTDSPYNTYTNKGLPPTAICNPGLSCIMAAILPDDNSYYYYVANPKDGSHIFSRTLEEHNRAVAKVSGQ